MREGIPKEISRREGELLTSLYKKDRKSAERYTLELKELLHQEELTSWIFTSIEEISPKHAQTFKAKGINTVYELIMTKPLRIEDYSKIKTIGTLSENEYAAVRGRVINIQRKRHISITIHDGTGSLVLNWFNITPFLRKRILAIRLDEEIICEGKVSHFGMYKTMNHPSIKKPSEYTPKVKAVYPSIGRINIGKTIQKAMKTSPPTPYEYLPLHIVNKHGFPLFHDFVQMLHSAETTDNTLNRLKYEELFFLMLGLTLQKRTIKERVAPAISSDPEGIITSVEKRTSYTLTNDQKTAIREILRDISSTKPMLRLLQGDVGSGKTLIALSCAYSVYLSGMQSVVMAPTQILASQWFEQIRKIFPEIPSELLVSSTKNKNQIYKRIKDGEISVIIGTHALLEEGVEFQKLGFVVIDEQHRFGVEQRKTLCKKGKFPHTLIMSATPIPRTLSMVLYSKSELSTLKEKPGNRKPVKSILYHFGDRGKAYEIAVREIKKKHQVYIVYPLIEKGNGSEEIGTAVEMYEKLRKTYFKDFNVALLHGRIKPQQKEEIFSRFKKGEIDCLISTTVIEVGVDSPSATVIIVENAERFGLSTLHQLRGRVGRSELQSYAIFITGKTVSDKSRERIEALLGTTDGFKIAELDYKLRGGGDILGTRQHGVPNMLYVDIFKDQKLIGEVKRDVSRIIEMGYPLNKCLQGILNIKWHRRFEYMIVG